MPQDKKKHVGQTKDAGFQIGARKTAAIPLEEAWDLLISPGGLRVWLGAPAIDWTPEGVEG